MVPRLAMVRWWMVLLVVLRAAAGCPQAAGLDRIALLGVGAETTSRPAASDVDARFVRRLFHQSLLETPGSNGFGLPELESLLERTVAVRAKAAASADKEYLFEKVYLAADHLTRRLNLVRDRFRHKVAVRTQELLDKRLIGADQAASIHGEANALLARFYGEAETIASAALRHRSAFCLSGSAPLDGTFRVTCDFGPRIHPISGRPSNHTGVDLGFSPGARVRSTGPGSVESTETDSIYGNVVVVLHPNGYRTRYCHLDSRAVKTGQRVKAGQVLGVPGNTGYSKGAHLHFEVHPTPDAPADPAPWLERARKVKSAAALLVATAH
ncbi:MAG: M23 family metallopeptidase [Candidatus Riflebacteria bacterium]|nr:M23 family metallopeptidase [Candidatus Riflebacteria bacterium]